MVVVRTHSPLHVFRVTRDSSPPEEMRYECGTCAMTESLKRICQTIADHRSKRDLRERKYM